MKLTLFNNKSKEKIIYFIDLMLFFVIACIIAFNVLVYIGVMQIVYIPTDSDLLHPGIIIKTLVVTFFIIFVIRAFHYLNLLLGEDF